MSWHAYKVFFRLLTPLHLGAGSVGNVQRTRPYLPGKALWGALTARLTRDVPALGGDYMAIGKQANDELAFSYFYPSMGDLIDCWPWDETGEFDWRYLGSYASTALDYNQNSAQEGTLHETEFIAPTSRDGKPVQLVGYLFARHDCSLPWQAALPRLQLGGERTYGWGRVKVASCVASSETLFGKHRLHLVGDRPLIELATGAHLLAHTLATGVAEGQIQGKLTPLVGRETREAHSHGQHFPAKTPIVWEPGATVHHFLQVQISEHGLWLVVNSG
jgi:hypothetical protein